MREPCFARVRRCAREVSKLHEIAGNAPYRSTSCDRAPKCLRAVEPIAARTAVRPTLHPRLHPPSSSLYGSNPLGPAHGRCRAMVVDHRAVALAAWACVRARTSTAPAPCDWGDMHRAQEHGRRTPRTRPQPARAGQCASPHVSNPPSVRPMALITLPPSHSMLPAGLMGLCARAQFIAPARRPARGHGRPCTVRRLRSRSRRCGLFGRVWRAGSRVWAPADARSIGAARPPAPP